MTVFFAVQVCKDKWKHIRTVFARHLHARAPSVSFATSRRPYYLQDAMQFMTPHIKKSSHREGKVPDAQGVRMTGTPQDSVSLDTATPAESSTILQQASASRHINHSDQQQRVLGKRQRLNDFNPVGRCIVGYKTQEMQPTTPDPDAEFLRSLLPDIKTMTAKQKRTFKIGVVKLIDEILDKTESDVQSPMNLTETSTV
jgi:hypothetical protein